MIAVSPLPGTPAGNQLFPSDQSLLAEPVQVRVVWAAAGRVDSQIKLRTQAKAAWQQNGKQECLAIADFRVLSLGTIL
jgi:hypothetical protein